MSLGLATWTCLEPPIAATDLAALSPPSTTGAERGGAIC
jgi:hypothetical protein